MATAASESDPGVETSGVLRVGTSGDYAPFSQLHEPSGEPRGFDPAVARAYAADRGLRIEWIVFRWPELLDDLAAGRFHVAMSGVTIRPERSVAGRFSIAVATSGAVALVRNAASIHDLDSLDRKGVRIAVNAGGHLERVTRARFPRADILAIEDNSAIPATLVGGVADAVVSDTLEAPHWMRVLADVHWLGPFTSDAKAYLLAPRLGELAEDLDAWLLQREADGSLAALRRQHLGAGAGPEPAWPLPALVVAVRQRLALMSFVAEAKRGTDLAVEDPEREGQVLVAALDTVRRSAERSGRSAPDPAEVRRFYRAQIEAAKSIQRTILSEPSRAQSHPTMDLGTELRPALLRIGDQIAWLLIACRKPQPRTWTPERVADALSIAHLPRLHARRIAESMAALCSGMESGPDAQ